MHAILHIGTEKTGTTSLQTVLAANREALIEKGVCYSRAAGEQSHLALPIYAGDRGSIVDLMVGEGIADDAALAQFRERLATGLADEVRRHPGARFVFSSEHCHSRLVDQPSIERLHALLAPLFETFEIIVYLRRQDRLMTSFYTTYLRGGGTDREIIAANAADNYYNYAAMIERWTSVFGQHITIVPFRQIAAGSSTIVDFLGRIGVDLTLADQPAINRSLSAEGQEALRLMNIHMPDRFEPAGIGAAEQLMHVSEVMVGTPGRRPPRDSARAFVDRYAAGNAWIEREFLNGARLFDDDYDDFPERDEAVPPEEVIPLFMLALFTLERQYRRSAALAAHEANERANLNARLADSVVKMAETAQVLATERSRLADAEHEIAEMRVAAGAMIETEHQLRVDLGYYAGLVHFDAGDNERAGEIVREALVLSHERPALWHLLGRIENRAGRCEEAIAAIDQAIALEPDNPVHATMRETFALPPAVETGRFKRLWRLG